MPSNLLASVFSVSAFRVENASIPGVAVIPSVSISKVTIKLSSETMKHQREDGSTVVDCRIIRPSMIVVSMFCPDANALAQLNALLTNQQDTFNISSRGLSFQSMVVNKDQIKQTPEVMSASPVTVTFDQLLVDNQNPVLCEQAPDSSLVDRGITLLDNTANSVSSLYDTASKSIAGLF